MNTSGIFIKLVLTNLKRLKSYIVPMLISVLILIFSCKTAGEIASKNLYKKDNFKQITLAYYLPADDDLNYNLMGLSFFENMESVKNTAELVQVSSIETGKNMVATKKADYFIIIPESFFSGIMNGTNPSIEIIIREDSSATAHIINELFLSYARYLGVAQAGVYSALDTARNHGLSDEEVGLIQDKVNATFLDRALNKDNFSITVSPVSQNEISLLEHYLATAIMISLFFVAIVFMPLLKGFTDGIKKQLDMYKIKTIHIFLSNLITCIVALYIAYLPCYVSLSIFSKNFNATGLITIIPVIVIMSLFIVSISLLSKNVFSANIVLLCFVIIIAYIGGGFLPNPFLPTAVQELSKYMPGEYMIDTIAKGIFL